MSLSLSHPLPGQKARPERSEGKEQRVAIKIARPLPWQGARGRSGCSTAHLIFKDIRVRSFFERTISEKGSGEVLQEAGELRCVELGENGCVSDAPCELALVINNPDTPSRMLNPSGLYSICILPGYPFKEKIVFNIRIE